MNTDLSKCIFAYLSIPDICKLRGVSKQWYNLVRNADYSLHKVCKNSKKSHPLKSALDVKHDGAIIYLLKKWPHKAYPIFNRAYKHAIYFATDDMEYILKFGVINAADYDYRNAIYLHSLVGRKKEVETLLKISGIQSQEKIALLCNLP